MSESSGDLGRAVDEAELARKLKIELGKHGSIEQATLLIRHVRQGWAPVLPIEEGERACPDCDGTGHRPPLRAEGMSGVWRTREDEPCRACKGKGVRVPVSTEEGTGAGER